MKFDNLNLDLKGTEVTLRRTEQETRSRLNLDGVYDEHAKLVFIFDVSGSMRIRVTKSYTDQYVWKPEQLVAVRQQLEEVITKANRLASDPAAVLLGLLGASPLAPNEMQLLSLADSVSDPAGNPTGQRKFEGDDEVLKERIVEFDMVSDLGFTVDWSRHTEVPPRRIDLVRKLAKQEIQNRFKRYPKSRVAVIRFASYTAVDFDDGDPEELWPKLEALQTGLGGGTNILGGLRVAMDVCRKNPSKVGIHHFIVVSDGEDFGVSSRIIEWIPVLRKSGVVLDYIHIGCKDANESLVEACKALSGEFVTVNSERDFTDKFVEAVRRKMLPPPA